MSAAQPDAAAPAPGPAPAPAPEARFVYGWLIIGVTFSVQFLVMGSVFYSFGVLLKPLAEGLGTDRFAISLALVAQMVLGAALGPIVGEQLTKRSIRAILLLGIALVAVGLFVVSQATALWQLYLGFGLFVSLGTALAGPLSCNALLANWFVRRRGTAMGVSQLGISLSGTFMVPLATWLVETYDWRTTAIVLGLLPFVVLTPLVWLVIVNRPEDRGLNPDGSPAGAPDPEPAPTDAWTFGRVLRDRRVWILALVLGPMFAGISAVVQALHSHVTDQGLSPANAATIVALMTFLGALAKPLFGTLADYTSKRGVLYVLIALQAAGVFGIAQADTFSMLLGSAALYGLGFGGVMPLWSVILGALFGRRDFARVMGMMGAMTLPFNLAGLPFTTWVHGATGSYVPAFLTFCALYAVSAILLLFLRIPRTATS